MSTKTTFKRVALVAVASLGIGVLSSVAPASATLTTWGAATNANQMQYVNGITLAQVTSSPTVGSVVEVNFGASLAAGDTNTSGGSTRILVNKFVGVLTTVPTNGGAQVIARNIASAGTTTTLLTGYTSETATAGSSNAIHLETATAGNGVAAAAATTATSLVGAGSFIFTPSKVGTYTLTVYNQSGDGAATGAQDSGEMSASLTVTVVAASAYSAGQSTSISNGNASGVAKTVWGTSDSSTTTKTAGKTIGQQAGAIQVTLKNADASAAVGLTVSATIAGSGMILADESTGAANGTGRSSSVVLGASSNVAIIHVSADGSAGTGTVTITVTDADGVSTTLSTETYTFVGSVTKFTRDADTGKVNIGVGETDTIDILPVDALGNTAASFTPVATSSNTLVATVTVATDKIIVTGVSSGTATITACNVACATTGAISATFSVRITKITTASYTLTFDKATYAPGEKMTLTVSAIDSNGSPVADSSDGQSSETSRARALYSSTGLTANAAITGLPAATTGALLVGGKLAYTMFAPLISGDVVISATQGAGVDAVIAGGTGAVVTATASVSGGSSDAALDAANEATDAAYAAADAADNATQAAVDAGAAAAMAQESADAALAAVTDLGIKVTGLLDALSKSLANIYKIIKAIQAKQK